MGAVVYFCGNITDRCIKLTRLKWSSVEKKIILSEWLLEQLKKSTVANNMTFCIVLLTNFSAPLLNIDFTQTGIHVFSRASGGLPCMLAGRGRLGG